MRTTARALTGGGTAYDVIGVRSLYADLDMASGKLPELAAAWTVIRRVSAMIGASPACAGSTGHGLHPQ